MPVRIAKVDAAPAVPMVELQVVPGPRLAAVGQTFSLDAPEDLVEFSLTNLEGLVLWLE